jgi:hypothetical protein
MTYGQTHAFDYMNTEALQIAQSLRYKNIAAETLTGIAAKLPD